MKRRRFIYTTLASPIVLSLPKVNKDLFSLKSGEVAFGMVADPHMDLLPGVEKRMEAFIEEVGKNTNDFIIQLGDFCFPKKENQSFLNTWNSCPLPKYHVLGNHDMDISDKATTMDFWGMDSKHYSFDEAGFHFIVLDANFIHQNGKYIDYDTANFYIDSQLRTWVSPDQLEWLENDLDNTDKPTIVFSHQSLASELWGIKNREAIRKLLERHNQKGKSSKVIACFNGHNHIDGYSEINGIYYIDINSMSYKWLGEKYPNTGLFSPEQYKNYPHLTKMALYKDPLYAQVIITEETLTIRGRNSEWMGPSPEDLGLNTENLYGVKSTPHISLRELKR